MTGLVPELSHSELPGVLEGAVPPGVYRWAPAPPSDQVAEFLQRGRVARWRCAHLDLEGVRDRGDFLARCAADLELPEWFGHSWDALADCLTDLSWWGEPAGYLVVVTGWEEFAAAAADAAATAADVLTAASGYWSARATPFTTLRT